MDELWWAIAEAPAYEMNDAGQVRYRDSKRCLKRKDDGELDDPYVVMRIDGVNVRKSIYVLQRQMMVDRRK